MLFESCATALQKAPFFSQRLYTPSVDLNIEAGGSRGSRTDTSGYHRRRFFRTHRTPLRQWSENKGEKEGVRERQRDREGQGTWLEREERTTERKTGEAADLLHAFCKRHLSVFALSVKGQ